MRKRQYDNKWKSEKRRKVSKLHDNVCEFENVCKDLFNRLGGKLCGDYDPEMGVFPITEMTYKALVENIQTNTEEHASENLFEKGCFREVALSKIQCTDRRVRIHRARGDSGQNEAERTNVLIGDALVDGGSMKWEYFTPYDGLFEEQINDMAAKDLES